MDVKTVTTSVGKLLSELKLNIHIDGARAARVRIWAGVLLMKLAGLVIGCNVAIDLDHGGDFDEKPRETPRNFTVLGNVSVPSAAAVDKRSPLYDPRWPEWAPKIEILLNGVVQQDVLAFDVDVGAIRVFARDRRHKLKLIGDEIQTKVRRGKVELRLCGKA